MQAASVAGLLLWSTAARAQTTPPADATPPAPPTITLPTVEVVGTTPLPGTGVDRDKVPANVQSLTSSDLALEGSPSVVTSFSDQAAGVNVNATLDDPFQPDLFYRGFSASPLLGTPQGLAVYQNGVRVNEAFGDTVNWDLIPDIAIDRVDVVSANPVYGLNALGGAVMIGMKNGFTRQGFAGEVAGGSFGQRGGIFEFGAHSTGVAAYVAGRIFDSDSWRQLSSDRVRQLYADVTVRRARHVFDLNFTGATNTLLGAGSTPAQELAVDRTLVFTSPQRNENQLEFLTMNEVFQATRTLTLQANAYGRNFHQRVVNGNTTDYTACATEGLCQPDEMTQLVTIGGASIPDLSSSGEIPIGQNDRERIHGVSVGGAVQATDTAPLVGRANHFSVGASVDRDVTDFQTSAEVGVINPLLQVLPSGWFVNTPENTPFTAVPVNLRATNRYEGVFLTDTFSVTPALAVSVSGRLNLAQIDLADRLGSNLTGSTTYGRFNPAAGATYALARGLTAYAGYSEGNRVPTPSEIECSDPARPCLLPSSLSADPPTLQQVVSHTYEAGLRSSTRTRGRSAGSLTWSAGWFRTNLTDDIYGVATSLSSGFFQNIGETRRQGLETHLAYTDARWSVFGTYDVIDATFQASLRLPSPSNPLADDHGDISVVPGDRLPGIPTQQVKAGATYRLTPPWRLGAVLIGNSASYFRGDESNQNPTLPGHVVVNLHSTYAIRKTLEVFVTVQNLFDTPYAFSGQFGDPTGIGAPGVPVDAATNGPGVDNRFLSPAPPIAVVAGLHVRF
ncbi:MAG TPA: TonB-dependent receptor [Vicinamibacterales bacterium]|nr:TonB-dependent receptor [Vicinamibacterales bacterium]